MIPSVIKNQLGDIRRGGIVFRAFSLAALLVCFVSLNPVNSNTARPPNSHGESIAEFILKNDLESAIKEIERLRESEVDGPTKAKMADDIRRIQGWYGNFTGLTLVEVARASDHLRRETWLLTSPEYVLRLQFIFYVTPEDGPKLMLFRWDHELWDLPWQAESDR